MIHAYLRDYYVEEVLPTVESSLLTLSRKKNLSLRKNFHVDTKEKDEKSVKVFNPLVKELIDLLKKSIIPTGASTSD